MIFTFDGQDYGHDKIFHGRDIDIDEWVSRIPGIDFFKATTYDDKLLELFKKSDIYEGVSYVADKYLYNVVTTARILVGNLAQTIGWLQTDFSNISKSFQQPAGDIVFQAFNTANAILNSDLFQRGMDALGAIPVVGWILKIIVKVAEMIYRLYDSIIKKKITQTEIELWNQPWIPVSQFSKEADEEFTKYTLDKIKNYDINYCFSPRNYWEDIADFLVKREKKGEKEKYTQFYNIGSLRNAEGTGFIPGTMVLSSHIRFPTKVGTYNYGVTGVLDTGEFYPTVRSLCNQLYQIVQKLGPSLYTVDPDHLSNLWENNIASLFEYCEESIKLGWAYYPTSCVKEMDDEDCKTEKPYFICEEDMAKNAYDSPFSISHPNCNKKSHIGNKIKIDDSGKNSQYVSFRKYLADTYFNGQFKDKNGKNIQTNIGDISKIDPSQSIPSKALKVLKERQQAGLDSLYCAYIAPDERFPGIKGNLKNKLTKNFNAILTSNEWKNLRWRDIVDQDLKAAVAEKAKKEKLQYDKDGPIVKNLSAKKAKSVLGDPEPPKPFEPIKPNRVGRDDSKLSSTISSNSSSSLIPLAGAGIAAYFLLK